jgi:hypothetical protein
MCCAFLVLLGGAPRLGIIFLWLFTDQMKLAYDSWVLPTLGFFILPWTTAFYALAYAPLGGVDGIGWFFVVFGFILDISSYTGGARQRMQQTAA